jgi:hypothetical protein
MGYNELRMLVEELLGNPKKVIMNSCDKLGLVAHPFFH